MVNINDNQIKYICKQMMGTDWLPKIDQIVSDSVYKIMSKCDSKLEVMYLLGAIKQLEDTMLSPVNVGYGSFGVGKDWDNVVAFVNGGFATTPIEVDAYGNEFYFIYDCIAFRPQDSTRNNLHHDFGIYSIASHDEGKLGNRDMVDSYSSHLREFVCAVEIDGYSVHKERRHIDALRDKNSNYKTFRFLEETSDPCAWIGEVLDYAKQPKELPPCNA